MSQSGSDAARTEVAAPLAAAGEAFCEQLRACLERGRVEGQSLALLVIDVGVIGRIDALWGYQTGDAARARVLASLRADVLRAEDFAAELGRDEIACVFSAVEGTELALLAADKALRTLIAPLWLGESEVYAAPSIGVALHPGGATDAPTLLRQARCACTAAAGLSGRIAIFEQGIDAQAATLIEEGRLRSAVAEDALELAFQPQFDLRFGQIMGMEAMLYWRDGGGARVPMRAAIAAAQAGGLLVKMVSSLLNRALRNCSEFRQRAGLDLRVAVNLPARALLEPELPELVERALRTWSLRPGRLMIEIDEVGLLLEHASAQAALLRLHEIGVKLSIDDAAAPLGSLFRLAAMPFHELKIDLSVAQDWTREARSASVLRALVELARQLKWSTIGVGVADEAQAARLAELGADFMQADFKGPAVSPEEFVARFAD